MGSDSAGDPSPAAPAAPSSRRRVATRVGRPSPPPARIRRRRPRLPVLLPGSPRPLFFRLPPSPPGRSVRALLRTTILFLVHARALSVLILTHFWTFRIFFFVCSSSIKYTTSHVGVSKRNWLMRTSRVIFKRNSPTLLFKSCGCRLASLRFGFEIDTLPAIFQASVVRYALAKYSQSL